MLEVYFTLTKLAYVRKSENSRDKVIRRPCISTGVRQTICSAFTKLHWRDKYISNTAALIADRHNDVTASPSIVTIVIQCSTPWLPSCQANRAVILPRGEGVRLRSRTFPFRRRRETGARRRRCPGAAAADDDDDAGGDAVGRLSGLGRGAVTGRRGLAFRPPR